MHLATIHNLIKLLEARSTQIASMQLTKNVLDKTLTGKLHRFANTSADLDKMANAIDILIAKGGVTTSDAEVMVRNLIYERNFYGSFCELGAYEWLGRNDVDFTAQVKLTPQEVLNPNGCTIDGRFNALAAAYFDIKGMGFQSYVSDQFLGALQNKLPNFTVTIDGNMDVAVKDIDKYAFPRLSVIANQLSNGGKEQIQELGWTIHARQKQPISSSIHTIDPYRLAEENRYYPLKTAGQFARLAPFMMIFAFAEQFNRLLFTNFGGSTDITLRSIARRAFIQLPNDATPALNFDDKVANGVSVGETAKLLSALLFINLDNDKAWLFTNPNATHRLTNYHIDQFFDFTWPPGLQFDDFAYDNY